MNKKVSVGDIEIPKGVDYWYIGKNETWCIKEDVPDWAKKEFAEYFNKESEMPDVDIAILEEYQRRGYASEAAQS